MSLCVLAQVIHSHCLPHNQCVKCKLSHLWLINTLSFLMMPYFDTFLHFFLKWFSSAQLSFYLGDLIFALSTLLSLTEYFLHGLSIISCTCGQFVGKNSLIILDVLKFSTVPCKKCFLCIKEWK